MKTFASIIGGLLLTAAVVVGGQYLSLWNLSFFGPKFENVKRDIYENTESFTEGKRQALAKYYNEFRAASPDEKMAIRNVMMQDFSNLNPDVLNSTQRGWYNEMVNYVYIQNNGK